MPRLCVLLMTGLLFVSMPLAATQVNIMDHGAVADGETDDTAAFQQALSTAAEIPGSTVFAPAGRYLIAGTITVPPATTLRGEYQGQGRQKGTILMSTGGKGQFEGPGCIVLVGGSQVRNIAFEYPEQDPNATEPTPFPYTITAAGDSRIEDIYLHNSYQGINLDGAHANLVRNIWGEPLKIGINSDHTYDISRIENVHFWPYFTLGTPLRSWVQQNGIAFQFGRSDWQYVLNTFCYGYQVGYRFYTSEEIPEKGWPAGQTNGNFVGIGADSVVIAIEVEDSFSIGVSIINGEFAPFAAVESWGVLLHEGNTGNLTLVNCNFWAVTNILAEVRSGSLNISACNINDWGIHTDSPAFVAKGGRLNVNNSTFNKGGLVAVFEGDDTRATFQGNMGTDEPLEIINRIGNRLVHGLNNPAVVVQDE